MCSTQRLHHDVSRFWLLSAFPLISHFSVCTDKVWSHLLFCTIIYLCFEDQHRSIKHLLEMLILCWGFLGALKFGVSIQPCIFQRPFEFPLFMFVVWSKLHRSRVPPSLKCIWTKNNARPPFRFFRSVCKLTIGNWCSKKYKNMLFTVNFDTFNKGKFFFFITFSQKCKGAQNCTSWISFKHFAAVFSLLATNDVWKDLKTLQIPQVSVQGIRKSRSNKKRRPSLS